MVALHKPTNLHVFGAVDDFGLTQPGNCGGLQGHRQRPRRFHRLRLANQLQAPNGGLPMAAAPKRPRRFATGYFVHTNGRMDLDSFGDRLEFRTKIIPHKGSDRLGGADAGAHESLHGFRYDAARGR